MSIATTIRQQHEAKEHDHRQKASARYRQLVRTTATGKEAKFDQIEQAAAAAGKSVQDFANDVEKQEKRIAAAARLKLVPAQREKLAELQQQIEGHRAILREAENRYDVAVQPLIVMANELDAQVDLADQLKRELLAGAGPEVVAAAGAAAEEHERADTALRAAREAVSRGHVSEELLQKHAGKAAFDAQHHEQIVAAAKAAEAALPQLQQDLAAADAKCQEARARLFEP